MSLLHIERALQHSRATSATEQAVLLVLASFADTAGARCTLPVITIAKYARTSEASVKRAIARLVHAGDITRVRRGRASNVYALNLGERARGPELTLNPQPRGAESTPLLIAQTEPAQKGHLMETFDELHGARFGEPARVSDGDRDVRQLRVLAERHGETLVVERMRLFFALRGDGRLEARGWTVAMFVQWFPRLAVMPHGLDHREPRCAPAES